MNSSSTLSREPNSASTLLAEPGVLVVKRHHFLVRWSHWLNVPLLFGLILSGISIYWASPIYQHKPDPVTGNFDVAADIGIWICAHVPGQHQYASPPDWKPTEITRVTVGADGGITLNGRVSTFGAFKIECKRLHRVDGALEYVRSTDGEDPRTARRVARIIVSTGVSVRFLGSDGEVPKDFQAAVPKVPL